MHLIFDEMRINKQKEENQNRERCQGKRQDTPAQKITLLESKIKLLGS